MSFADFIKNLFGDKEEPQPSVDTEQFLREVREKLEPHRLSMCTLLPTPSAPEFPWSSKFGGVTYLPVGMEPPRTHDGIPLRILAQICFDEAPSIDGFPETGLLQFFIAQDDLYGLDFGKPLEEIFQNPNGYRVMYHPTPSGDAGDWQVVEQPAHGDDYFPVNGEYALKFEASSELPCCTDYRFDLLADLPSDLEDDLLDACYEALDGAGSKLGGYAMFTQQDPRSAVNDPEWLLLFQMDTSSVKGVDIMWGDTGVANFFIEPEALQLRDFSRVWYNWDCC